MTDFADPEHDDYEQRIILASGSAAQPSLTFSGDETKGFYFDGTDIQSIGVAGGGVTYPLLADDGTVAAPSYAFTSFPDSGLFMDGSGFVSMAFRGATVLRFQTGNTVVLPAPETLEIDKDGAINDPSIFLGSTQQVGLSTVASLGANVDTLVIQSTQDGDTQLRFRMSVGPAETRITTDDQDAFKLDHSTVAGDTRMLLWDVDSGALVRVSVGVADSGGVGYKVLRIPN